MGKEGLGLRSLAGRGQTPLSPYLCHLASLPQEVSAIIIVVVVEAGAQRSRDQPGSGWQD